MTLICLHCPPVEVTNEADSKQQGFSGYYGFDIPNNTISFFLLCIFWNKTEDFDPYFSGRRKLLPRHSDLSFYNWDTNYSTSNSTANYQVRKGGGEGDWLAT